MTAEDADVRPRGRDSEYVEPRVNDLVAHRFERRHGWSLSGAVWRVDGHRVRVVGDGWAAWFPASDLYLTRSITAAEINAERTESRKR